MNKKAKKTIRNTSTNPTTPRRDRKQEKKVVALRDVELKHVSGGFCVTPWD